MIHWLNQNSGAIQAISTIVLVGVTIWYAISTKKMASLMKDQITPRITIENIAVGSPFLEDWFKSHNYDKSSFISLKSTFDIRNEGNASGSIYKPNLLISTPGKDHAWVIPPTTKSYESYTENNLGPFRVGGLRTTYYGGTILLSGGGSERVELSYQLDLKADGDIELINLIKENPQATRYSLITKDNNGREYRYPITDIQEENGFGLS